VNVALRPLLAGLLLGRAAAAGDPDLSKPPALQPGSRIVFLIGEEEYNTAETLPEFAKRDLEPRGFKVTLLQDQPTNRGSFAGLAEALAQADVLFISVRRRALPRLQLEAIRAHLDAGKPLIGIRTASHAFAPRDKEREELVVKDGRAEWPRFDPEVLGGNYQGHHGAGTRTLVTAATGAAGHPILAGVETATFHSPGSLYRVSPLAPSATVLLIGSIPGEAAEPVAWVNTYGPKHARVFYTSLGHPDDFGQPMFRQLLLNGLIWALDPQAAHRRPAPAR